ncbi:uncharacterized protein LOC129595118 [Paramacrobiotus metropolitanus]|uniref:uncharacterized protein LOC129595118 n=1 Tax=Paramacrobiotus metropolitanus TaxID=2943436 RepID=UPI0024455F48|nr:uncharacterized protein LOC129595118 [Paramacrobiotus metropolitanus]
MVTRAAAAAKEFTAAELKNTKPKAEALESDDESDEDYVPNGGPSQWGKGRGKGKGKTNGGTAKRQKSVKPAPAATTADPESVPAPSSSSSASHADDPDVIILDGDDDSNPTTARHRLMLKRLGRRMPNSIARPFTDATPPARVKATECVEILEHTARKVEAIVHLNASLLKIARPTFVGKFFLVPVRSVWPEIVKVVAFPDANSALATVQSFGYLQEGRTVYELEVKVDGAGIELSVNGQLIEEYLPKSSENRAPQLKLELTIEQADAIFRLWKDYYSYDRNRFQITECDNKTVWICQPPDDTQVKSLLDTVRGLLEDSKFRHPKNSTGLSALKKMLAEHTDLLRHLRDFIRIPAIRCLESTTNSDNTLSDTFYAAFQEHFSIYNVPSDGHCFFHAVSMAVFLDGRFHLHLRLAAIDILASRYHDFLPHLQSQVPENHLGLLEVVYQTAVTAPTVGLESYGGGIHLMALATALHRPICSYQGFFDHNQPENWKDLSSDEVAALIAREKRLGKKHFLYHPLHTPASATYPPTRVLYTNLHYMACVPKQEKYSLFYLPSTSIPAPPLGQTKRPAAAGASGPHPPPLKRRVATTTTTTTTTTRTQTHINHAQFKPVPAKRAPNRSSPDKRVGKFQYASATHSSKATIIINIISTKNNSNRSSVSENQQQQQQQQQH